MKRMITNKIHEYKPMPGPFCPVLNDCCQVSAEDSAERSDRYGSARAQEKAVSTQHGYEV